MRVKRYIIALLLLCMVVAVLPTAAAASNDENHIPVTYYISNGVLTVVGTGVMGALPISDGPGDQKIREVVIAEGITEISAHVFSNLPHLEKVTIADSVEVICGWAFSGCEKLKTLELPANLEIIEEYAFAQTVLEEIYIPASVRVIGDHAFHDTRFLKNIQVDPKNRYFSAHEGILYNKGQTHLIWCPREFTGDCILPSTVKTIEPEAFTYCFKITGLSIPGGVSIIAEKTFDGCKNLTWVELAEGVKTIESGAFASCVQITGITFPASIEEIKEGAFSWCQSIKEIRFLGDPPMIWGDAFTFVTADAYYPAGNTEWDERMLRQYGGTLTWEAYDAPVYRLYGSNRWTTSIGVAEEMKVNRGVDRFDTIIVASGMNFADALSGSYLAAVKDAPILLCWSGDARYEYLNDEIVEYIEDNLSGEGTVYILGGTSAVPESLEEELSGIHVKRLAGTDRFETNLLILAEAGVKAGDEVLVCTSTNFADSLSASATAKPILLVFNELGQLYGAQSEFLEELTNCSFTIIGGENAVGTALAEAIGAYGEVARLAGADRFETSVLVAQKYFENPECAVLAYAWNYPDGLCGGALAYTMDSPLILTMTNYEMQAAVYVQDRGIGKGLVLGGNSLIADDSVRAVFELSPNARIPTK